MTTPPFALLAATVGLAIAGCAAAPPPSPAQQAEATTCTAQADATYKAQNYAELSRTSQAGLLYAPMPNHVFDAQTLGALHVRDSQITDCERNGGDGSGPGLPGAMPVTPHIIP